MTKASRLVRHMLCAALAIALTAASATRGVAQRPDSARVPTVPVVVRHAGPGMVGRELAYALSQPHATVLPGDSTFTLTNDRTWPTTIVLARDVDIAGHVAGDVWVVGGNAFVHPGARVDGRVVAIGGGAYPSFLAFVAGGLLSFKDFTFTATPDGIGYALDYAPIRRAPSPVFSLPGIYGVRLPTYDRTDGVSLPFAPLISLDTTRIEIEPTITYRSQLGAWDPSLSVRYEPGRLNGVDLFAGRLTTTNDAWIWSDLVNSASSLFVGIDTRNYYRTDRAEVRAHHLWEGASASFAPYVGVRSDRSVAARPLVGATSEPWSVFARDRTDRMLRPNPAIPSDRLTSGLVGADLSWGTGPMHLTGSVGVEAGHASARSGTFVQTTADAVLAFPTLRGQSYQLTTHLMLTAADTAPMERWGYLGGSGTLQLDPLLSLGGDDLLYLENAYYIPIHVALPVVGEPTFAVREILAGANVARFPQLEQNFGFRLGVSVVRFDLLFDATHRRTSTGFGFSLTR